MHIHRIKYKDIEQIPQLKIHKTFKQDFQGSAPAPFIGRYGYPEVNIGLLSPQIIDYNPLYDSPQAWSQQNTAINTVASLRYGLVNSRQKWKIKHQPGRFLDIIQEIGMAQTAAEVEVNLKNKPTLDVKPEREIIPFGPASSILRARITANTKINSAVEKIAHDTDLKASSGILSLYHKGFEENSLSKLMSVGTLGLSKNRKLVPTRWSITAVDDTIGKQLITEIKDLPLGDCQLHFGGGWGNYYLLLFFPEIWSYELFETYLGKSVNPWSKNGFAYSTDYEGYEGRKTYADETAGGYYAARVPILEKMKQMKRQSSCLALRFITDEYTIPLGVWVCREATRKSVQEKPLQFASQELMLKYAAEFIKKKFSVDLRLLLRQSRLLLEKKEQKKLSAFGGK
ncbi:MAG: hypothetical protein Q8R37_05125 [Nanoarchaeota archaeon]|nr:hypothetical protein [Nanoarchaeota archaeon]